MKTLSTLFILFVASLLGGCAMTQTNKDRLESHGAGEVRAFVLAGVVSKDLSKMKCDDESQGKEFAAYAMKEICPNAMNLQIVPGIYHTHPLKGIKTIRAAAPLSMNIENEDIIEVSMLIREDGSNARPALVTRLVRKAKDTGPDCKWEGGKSATSAFLSGGVVCEGWDWKKQKFSK